ncbi:hypothetical protein [Leucothrix pacifica]|uniref:hypothetical protein n=1 Tax=Leucothrix pacifica TaxID=1247513 RepID=UPI0011B1F563|nr:hypothetical protein [Leucothrix pacifica]
MSGIAAAGNNVVTARQVTNVQKKQAQSIEQGVKVGKLTPKEAKKLNNEQAEIDELKEELAANGSLDTEELALLFKRLETARNNINKLLRNNVSSYGQLDRNSLKTASAAID